MKTLSKISWNWNFPILWIFIVLLLPFLQMWFAVLCCCVTTMLSQECLKNFPDCFFFLLYKALRVFSHPSGYFFHSTMNKVVRIWTVAKHSHFPQLVCLSFQHPVPNLSLSGGKMQGRAPLSMSIQPISAHKVTAQKSVNTRRNSTLRSCVLLCGVSWESLGRCVEGRHSRRGWQCLLGRFHSCIAALLAEGAGVDPWADTCVIYMALPSQGQAGKHMSYSCRGLCTSEREKVLIKHQVETMFIGRVQIWKCFSSFCGSWDSAAAVHRYSWSEPWPSGRNPNTNPSALMCVRYSKDPEQGRSFQKLVLLSSCCHCLFWTSLNHCLNVHALYRVSFTWCKTKMQHSDHSQQL